MQIEEFLRQLNEIDMAITHEINTHSEKLPNGIRAHKAGQLDTCPHCIKLKANVIKIQNFEKEHLGTTRLEKDSIYSRIAMMRGVVKMMKEQGEI